MTRRITWPCSECGGATRILTTTGASRPLVLLGSRAIVRSRRCVDCGAPQAATVELDLTSARRADRALTRARAAVG